MEIVHQFPQRRIAAALRIHIEDMGPILERFSRLPDVPVDVIDGQALFQNVPLGNENNIGLAQGIVPVTGAGQVGIQQTAVVPGPVGVSAFIPALNFYIVCTSRFVYSQNVQPDGPALKIFDVVLPVDLHYTPYFFCFAKGVFRKSALLPDESFRKFQVADGMKVLHQGYLGGKRAEKSLYIPAHLGKFDIPVTLFPEASVGCEPMQQRRTPFLRRSHYLCAAQKLP